MGRKKSNDHLWAFRAPRELFARVDAHVLYLQKELPGVKITRSDVMRLLIEKGLAGFTTQKGKT